MKFLFLLTFPFPLILKSIELKKKRKNSPRVDNDRWLKSKMQPLFSAIYKNQEIFLLLFCRYQRLHTIITYFSFYLNFWDQTQLKKLYCQIFLDVLLHTNSGDHKHWEKGAYFIFLVHLTPYLMFFIYITNLNQTQNLSLLQMLDSSALYHWEHIETKNVSINLQVFFTSFCYNFL